MTHDRQYCKSFREAETSITKILESKNINTPKLLNAVQFPLNTTGSYADLYGITSKDKVIELWNKVIATSLKEMLKDVYLGVTYKYGSKGISAKCIYIDAKESLGCELRKSDGLVCISGDLQHYKIISGDEDNPLTYWNMSKPVTLPVLIEEEPYFSFYIKKLKDEDLKWMRKKGNIVFYYDI